VPGGDPRDRRREGASQHITGGGFTENIQRVLPDGLGVRVDLARVPATPLFGWLAATGGIAESEMLRTFNCGVGMVVVTAAEKTDAVVDIFRREGETVAAARRGDRRAGRTRRL
jgi:phosphoribosylformylglycinamidine cyclo-ligase